MRAIRNMVIMVLAMTGLPAMAQIQKHVADPTNWSYEAKKLNGDEYELTFKLRLEDGWHIWSLNPGGDGYEIVPSFKFDKDIVVKGKPEEKGHASTVLMEGMENKVTYLSGEVEYRQVVKVKGGKVRGEHEYQVCNDNMCLPPTTKKFELSLKGN